MTRTGFEPVTNCLKGNCSTIELAGRKRSYNYIQVLADHQYYLNNYELGRFRSNSNYLAIYV